MLFQNHTKSRRPPPPPESLSAVFTSQMLTSFRKTGRRMRFWGGAGVDDFLSRRTRIKTLEKQPANTVTILCQTHDDLNAFRNSYVHTGTVQLEGVFEGALLAAATSPKKKVFLTMVSAHQQSRLILQQIVDFYFQEGCFEAPK